MTTFTEQAAAALTTIAGQAFSLAGFGFETTGGGCTAWMREIGATGCHILITDSTGCSALLDEREPDCWQIGAHGFDGGFSASREATSEQEAVAVADEVQRLVLAQDWAALAKGAEGCGSELPLAFAQDQLSVAVFSGHLSDAEIASSEPEWSGTLAQFLTENDNCFTENEVRHMVRRLVEEKHGSGALFRHFIGGGAQPSFTLAAAH